jgi:hypothetical protein
MITQVFIKIVKDGLKEIRRITYRNGKVVERTYTPGHPVPEEVTVIRDCNTPTLIQHPECQAYNYHYNIQL